MCRIHFLILTINVVLAERPPILMFFPQRGQPNHSRAGFYMCHTNLHLKRD